MGVDIQRKYPDPPPVNPPISVKLETEGGSGNHIEAQWRPSKTGQIAFSYHGTGAAHDNLNVSTKTVKEFCAALLELIGATDG